MSTSTTTATAPAPRRIVGTHAPDGGANVLNEELTMFEVPGMDGMKVGIAYVQNGFPHDPHTAVEGAKTQPSARIIDGAIINVLEVAPGAGVPVHYTNSLDYVVMTLGEMEYGDHEGKTHKVKAGDIVVQCAVAHSWKNNSKEIARMVVTVMPSQPFKIEGKDLTEAKGMYNLNV